MKPGQQRQIRTLRRSFFIPDRLKEGHGSYCELFPGQNTPFSSYIQALILKDLNAHRKHRTTSR